MGLSNFGYQLLLRLRRSTFWIFSWPQCTLRLHFSRSRLMMIGIAVHCYNLLGIFNLLWTDSVQYFRVVVIVNAREATFVFRFIARS